MARRRLTTAPAAADVPRAERFAADAPAPTAGRAPGLPGAAPIARVAADAAGAAALEEMSRTLRNARETGRLVLDIPLENIAADHLSRDRLPAEDADMVALRESLRAHGQRTPIEVTPLTPTAGQDGATLPYGLISGWRRLMAFKALHAATGAARFASIQALVRRPETAADAYIAMVEENEIRLGLSQYERARVAALAAARGVFESEEAALRALFATASRPKRSRIRAFLEIYRALDGALRFPAHLPERLGLALVERLRAGDAPRIAAALAEAASETPEAELALLERLVRPQPKPSAAPSAAAEPILPGVTLEQALRGRTLTLKLKGRGVTPDLAEAIRAQLLRLGAGE